MFRAPSVGNKLIYRKIEEKEKQVHYNKLRKVKSTIDSSCPAAFHTFNRRAKREQMLEDRYTEIERENRLLLEKMSNIVSSHKAISRPPRKKSLNSQMRKQKLVEITMQNHALFKRIQGKQPIYNIKAWKEDRKRNKGFLKFMCDYPYALGKRRIQSESAGIGKGKAGKLSPIKEVVFKKGIELSETNFVVEVLRSPEKLYIIAYDTEKPDCYNLEMPLEEACTLMGGDSNYFKLVDMLNMENSELVLNNQT